MRPSGRSPDQLRPITLTRNYTKHAEGSVLVEFGDTKVLCTATVEARVPRFLKGTGQGWPNTACSPAPPTHAWDARHPAANRGGAPLRSSA